MALEVVPAPGEDARIEKIASRAEIGAGTLYRRLPPRPICDDIRARGIFPVIPEATLRATLGILARTVEQ